MDSVLRGAAIYLLVLVIVRISGRRTLAELTPFDFVLLLIVAETTQQALLGDDFSITNAAVLIVTLFLIDIVLSHFKSRVPRLARILDGVPTVLVRDGKIDRHAIERSRVSEDDILVAGRKQHGLENMGDIKHAVLETDSGISVIPRKR